MEFEILCKCFVIWRLFHSSEEKTINKIFLSRRVLFWTITFEFWKKKMNFLLKSIFHNQNILFNQFFAIFGILESIIFDYFRLSSVFFRKYVWRFKQKHFLSVHCHKFDTHKWNVNAYCVCSKTDLKTSQSMSPIFIYENSNCRTKCASWNFTNIKHMKFH